MGCGGRNACEPEPGKIGAIGCAGTMIRSACATGRSLPMTLARYARSCRLNRVIPDLSTARNTTAWYRLELAKRRMLYTLLGLGLPVVPKKETGDSGLAFEFLEDSTDGDANRVLTGHDNGLITLNIAEADDVHREKQRALQKEPYRTLLGHFRHEIGHYFWDRLILNGPKSDAFRAIFGDERADYQEALQRHYREGPPGRIGRVNSSARTRPCIRGKIGRNHGPTICIWSMRSRRPEPPASRSGRSGPTSPACSRRRTR